MAIEFPQVRKTVESLIKRYVGFLNEYLTFPTFVCEDP